MHRQTGANCTDAKLYFLDDFPHKKIIQMGPTSNFVLDFWNFFNFAMPLNMTKLNVFTHILTQDVTHSSFRRANTQLFTDALYREKC